MNIIIAGYARVTPKVLELKCANGHDTKLDPAGTIEVHFPMFWTNKSVHFGVTFNKFCKQLFFMFPNKNEKRILVGMNFSVTLYLLLYEHSSQGLKEMFMHH